MARRRHNHPEDKDSPAPRQIHDAIEAARRENPFNSPWD